MGQNIIQTSKQLSFLLRHHPEKGNLTLDAAGWTPIPDVLKALNVTLPFLMRVVAENNKKRFEVDGDRIRASQGHHGPPA